MIRQFFAEWSFTRWGDRLRNPKGGTGWTLLGVIFFVLVVIGTLSKQP